MTNQKIIEFKIPLPWLISVLAASATFMVTLGWSAAIQSSKIDTLIQASAKLERRLEEREARQEALKDVIYAIQRANDNNTLRITALEARVK